MNCRQRELVLSDLRHATSYFPLRSLRHLRDNAHRLVRGPWTTREGGGCIFNLLSEPLPLSRRIDNAPALTRHFTGGNGWPFKEFPEYQPARWLTRLWDGQGGSRYEGLTFLSQEDMLALLDIVIVEREKEEQAGPPPDETSKTRRKGPVARRAVPSEPVAR